MDENKVVRKENRFSKKKDPEKGRIPTTDEEMVGWGRDQEYKAHFVAAVGGYRQERMDQTLAVQARVRGYTSAHRRLVDQWLLVVFQPDSSQGDLLDLFRSCNLAQVVQVSYAASKLQDT